MEPITTSIDRSKFYLYDECRNLISLPCFFCNVRRPGIFTAKRCLPMLCLTQTSPPVQKSCEPIERGDSSSGLRGVEDMSASLGDCGTNATRETDNEAQEVQAQDGVSKRRKWHTLVDRLSSYA